MELFEVGKRYPKYATEQDFTAITIGKDYILTLIAMMRRPASTEIQDYRAGESFEICAGVVENIIVFTFKIGNQPWCDSFYHPQIDDNRYTRVGNMFNILLFDSDSGELKVNRIIGLSASFINDIKEMCRQTQNTTLSYYQNTRSRLLNTYSSDQLRDIATSIFKLTNGAVSDLNISPIQQQEQRPSIVDKLPVELQPFYVYEGDGGHCIKCIPASLLNEAMLDGNYYDYCASLPVRYVLEIGYKMSRGFPVVQVKYDSELGADVPESYHDF